MANIRRAAKKGRQAVKENLNRIDKSKNSQKSPVKQTNNMPDDWRKPQALNLIY